MLRRNLETPDTFRHVLHWGRHHDVGTMQAGSATLEGTESQRRFPARNLSYFKPCHLYTVASSLFQILRRCDQLAFVKLIKMRGPDSRSSQTATFPFCTFARTQAKWQSSETNTLLVPDDVQTLTTFSIFSPPHQLCSRCCPARWLYTASSSLSWLLSEETWTGGCWMTYEIPGLRPADPSGIITQWIIHI